MTVTSIECITSKLSPPVTSASLITLINRTVLLHGPYCAMTALCSVVSR